MGSKKLIRRTRQQGKAEKCQMSAFCGLCSSTYKRQKPLLEKWGELNDVEITARDRTFEWAREDQLSAIIELDSTKGTPQWEKTEAEAHNWGNTAGSSSHKPHILEPVEEEVRTPVTPKGKGPSYPTHSDRRKTKRPPLIRRNVTMSGRTTPSTPRPIQPPPRDVSFRCCVFLRRILITRSLNQSLESMPLSYLNTSPHKMRGFLVLHSGNGCSRYQSQLS